MSGAAAPGRFRHARILAACATVMAFSCPPESCRRPDAAERALMLDWLECVDCRGKLASVMELATRKPLTVDVLVDDAMTGPEPARLHLVEAGLDSSYERTRKLAVAEGVPLLLSASKATHLGKYLNRYISLYRTRAVLALGCIHTTTAMAAVNTAANAPGLAGAGPDLESIHWARDSLDTDAKRAVKCHAIDR